MRIVTLLAAMVTGAALLAEDKPDGEKEKAVELKIGDKAPVFTAKDDAGKEWKSTDHVGKKIVVVYFYPASFTGGCTKQACGFRDDMKPLADKGVEIVGVSGDAVRTQELFKKEHKLNFSLLADEKGEIARAFGVPAAKGGSVKHNVDGKEETFVRGVTTSRWTFVIDKSGKIAHKETKVSAADDSKAVLAAIEKLK